MVDGLEILSRCIRAVCGNALIDWQVSMDSPAKLPDSGIIPHLGVGTLWDSRSAHSGGVSIHSPLHLGRDIIWDSRGDGFGDAFIHLEGFHLSDTIVDY